MLRMVVAEEYKTVIFLRFIHLGNTYKSNCMLYIAQVYYMIALKQFPDEGNL